MGKFDGMVILGGLWMFFLWGPSRGGDGGGEEKSSTGYVQKGRLSLDDTRFQTDPFFVLYIIY